MPEKFETVVDGDTATVRAIDGGDLTDAIRSLLKETDDPGEVRTSTSDPAGLALVVPTELARKAGLVDAAEGDGEEGSKRTSDRNGEQSEGDGVSEGQGDAEEERSPQQKAAATRRAREAAQRASKAKDADRASDGE